MPKKFMPLALTLCIIAFVYGFLGKEQKTRKMSNFDLPGWRGNLFTTDQFVLINILKICHNNILSFTYPISRPYLYNCVNNGDETKPICKENGKIVMLEAPERC